MLPDMLHRHPRSHQLFQSHMLPCNPLAGCREASREAMSDRRIAVQRISAGSGAASIPPCPSVPVFLSIFHVAVAEPSLL